MGQWRPPVSLSLPVIVVRAAAISTKPETRGLLFALPLITKHSQQDANSDRGPRKGANTASAGCYQLCCTYNTPQDQIDMFQFPIHG